MGMERVNYEARELAYRLKLQLARQSVRGARLAVSDPMDANREPPTANPQADLVQVQHDLDLLIRLADLQATEFEVRDFAPRLNQFVALCKSLVSGARLAVSDPMDVNREPPTANR